MALILKRQPVANLGKVIEFELDNTHFVRCLVMTVHVIGEEVSIASPVGRKLANAQPGDQFQIHNPGDEYLIGKVLSISDSIGPVAA